MLTEVLAVPFVVSDVFEEDFFHVTIAEAAEQTGYNRSLRNPSALMVGPATQKSKLYI